MTFKKYEERISASIEREMKLEDLLAKERKYQCSLFRRLHILYANDDGGIDEE